ENDRRTVAAFERILTVYQEFERGAASGISQLQVDQIEQNLVRARQLLVQDELQYRFFMDQFKLQIGLPPDVPMVLDRSLLSGFRSTFNEIERWSAREDRDPNELLEIIGRLPKLDDVILDGRAAFAYGDPKKLEDYLLTAERTALECRLDLM